MSVTLSPNQLAIATALAETGGALTDEIRQELDGIDLNDWSKADPIVVLIRQAEADQALAQGKADAIAKQAEPALAEARIAANSVEALKGYLLARMVEAECDKLEGPLSTVRLQANPIKITWNGKGPIPVPFQRQKIELDAARAKIALADGTLPDGFQVTQGRHLRIE